MNISPESIDELWKSLEKVEGAPIEQRGRTNDEQIRSLIVRLFSGIERLRVPSSGTEESKSNKVRVFRQMVRQLEVMKRQHGVAAEPFSGLDRCKSCMRKVLNIIGVHFSPSPTITAIESRDEVVSPLLLGESSIDAAATKAGGAASTAQRSTAAKFRSALTPHEQDRFDRVVHMNMPTQTASCYSNAIVT